MNAPDLTLQLTLSAERQFALEVMVLREMLNGAFDKDCDGCWQKLERSSRRVARYAKAKEKDASQHTR